MSLRHLADELAGQGHKVSAPTVAGLLREENFSLQGNAKTIEGGCHRDRDAQFAHINTTAEETHSGRAAGHFRRRQKERTRRHLRQRWPGVPASR